MKAWNFSASSFRRKDTEATLVFNKKIGSLKSIISCEGESSGSISLTLSIQLRLNTCFAFYVNFQFLLHLFPACPSDVYWFTFLFSTQSQKEMTDPQSPLWPSCCMVQLSQVLKLSGLYFGGHILLLITLCCDTLCF